MSKYSRTVSLVGPNSAHGHRFLLYQIKLSVIVSVPFFLLPMWQKRKPKAAHLTDVCLMVFGNYRPIISLPKSSLRINCPLIVLTMVFALKAMIMPLGFAKSISFIVWLVKAYFRKYKRWGSPKNNERGYQWQATIHRQLTAVTVLANSPAGTNTAKVIHILQGLQH